MNQTEFKELFRNKVYEAIAAAPELEKNAAGKEWRFEVHGGGQQGQVFDFDAALDVIFIDDSRFYPTIDIGLRHVSNDTALFFLGVSGREPVPFGETWNHPPGGGPFKVVVSSDA